MKLGLTEILVILVVALVVLGPDQLPSYARKLGNALRAFRNAANETTEGIRENVIEPLNEAQKPLREALEPVQEMQQELNRNVKDMEKSLKDVTSPISSAKPAVKEAIPEQGKEPVKEAAVTEAEPAADAESPDELPEPAAETKISGQA